MGNRHRDDNIRAELARTARDSDAIADALATVERFNARLAGGKTVWFWPTIAAALVTQNHWVVIACDSCGTIIDMDLRVKRRDGEAPISVALGDVRCPRCNGHGRTRITGSARFPSI